MDCIAHHPHTPITRGVCVEIRYIDIYICVCIYIMYTHKQEFTFFNNGSYIISNSFHFNLYYLPKYELLVV